MTNVAMGLVSAVAPRGNDRGGKSGADAGAFDRALSEKPAKRAPQSRQDEEPATEPRWRLASAGDKHPLARQEQVASAAYDDFREMLLPHAAAEPTGDDGKAALKAALEASLPDDDAPRPADLFSGRNAAPKAPAADDDESTVEPNLPEDGVPQPAVLLSMSDVAPQASTDIPAPAASAREGRRDAVPAAGDERPARGRTAASGDAGPASPRRESTQAAGPVAKAATGPAGDPTAGDPTAGSAADNENAQAATPRAQTAAQVSAATAQDRPAVDAPRPLEGRPGRQPTPAATQARAAAAAPADAGGARGGSGEGIPEEILRQLEAARPAGQAAAAPAQPRAEAAAPAQAGIDRPQPVVSVLGFTTSSAPVVPANVVPTNLAAQLSTTGAGVVAAIEAEPTWRAASADAASQRGQAPGVVSSLRIQLNPAELGMVTARLVASGSQLEIEIRVESNDARQKLAQDANAIVKALRGVGYDVERVTIHQTPQAGAAATQQQGVASRDPFMQQGQQQQDQAGANAGGRNGQDSGNGATTARRNDGEPAAERAGGGVYI